jgi:hypothetical protein
VGACVCEWLSVTSKLTLTESTDSFHVTFHTKGHTQSEPTN